MYKIKIKSSKLTKQPKVEPQVTPWRKPKRSHLEPTTIKFWADMVDTSTASTSDTKFQAPDHEQEELADLTDDNSPHVPGMQSEVKKSVIKGNLGVKFVKQSEDGEKGPVAGTSNIQFPHINPVIIKGPPKKPPMKPQIRQVIPISTKVVPIQQTNVVPNQPTNLLPNRPTNFGPNQPTKMVPNPTTNVVPIQLTKMVSNQPINLVPNPPTMMVPIQPTNLVPNQPTKMVPNQPYNLVPNPPTNMMTPPEGVPFRHLLGMNRAFMSYPKGIPASFLPQHQLKQIHYEVQQKSMQQLQQEMMKQQVNVVRATGGPKSGQPRRPSPRAPTQPVPAWRARAPLLPTPRPPSQHLPAAAAAGAGAAAPSGHAPASASALPVLVNDQPLPASGVTAAAAATELPERKMKKRSGRKRNRGNRLYTEDGQMYRGRQYVPSKKAKTKSLPQNPTGQAWSVPAPTLAKPERTLCTPQLYTEPTPISEANTSNELPIDIDGTPISYSPTEAYDDNKPIDLDSDTHEDSPSPDVFHQGQKRLSAFDRLGPLAQPPKKPKLTINLMFNKEQSVREVVDLTEPEKEPYVPVHLRPNIQTSTDDTVMKFLAFWPWRKQVHLRKTASVRISKTAMMLEQEQMDEFYEKDNFYLQVTIKGYPPSWKKEDVLDALLEIVALIPCFIEFTTEECKFLVIRSRMALLAIHKIGFLIHKDGVELTITISATNISLNEIDFIPRLVLRKRLSMVYNSEDSLDLSEFTTKDEISHFIYFPLNNPVNQADLAIMQSVVAWEYLTTLNLSRNRITSIDRLHLHRNTPKLKHLDLSHNQIEKISTLIRCRELPLQSIKLEGNPLCNDYIDPAHYVKVIRMIYPTVREIDGVAVQLKGDLPKFHKNYCLHGADHIVDKFLDVFFPLLDSPPEDRLLIDELYDEMALVTITYQHKYLSRQFRTRMPISGRYKCDDSEKEVVVGITAITKLISKWPPLKHDPYTFTVDVLYHTDTSTIIRIDGIMKLTSETLAEDEHVVSFTRTVILRSHDGVEYKIRNEMIHWSVPTGEYADHAFQITKIRKRLSLELETNPDNDLKEKLTEIFMKITELDKKQSERCLDKKDWNIKNALEHFIQLLKLDDLHSLNVESSVKE